MTRFENATQSPMNMSLAVAFCIAAYLEQSGKYSFTDDKLKEFMNAISYDIEEWLSMEFEEDAE